MPLNHKAFMYKTQENKSFIVVFLTFDGDLYCKSFGHHAFANQEFANVQSVNFVTRWLENQGYVYTKRLPLPKNKIFTSESCRQINDWLKTARLLDAA